MKGQPRTTLSEHDSSLFRGDDNSIRQHRNDAEVVDQLVAALRADAGEDRSDADERADQREPLRGECRPPRPLRIAITAPVMSTPAMTLSAIRASRCAWPDSRKPL
jgi:hypothetical protein